ncbi:GGDEF domain-containing protein [Chitiniphilus purpureus]|uniref:diguanylate cyclase n=1 Tax=Chitiniphilus purpureus TaxID=2981137 RepID=A0ABY6DUJ8_9NEIS|nr:sensor domain-containing diguanylate cyclase [Chitiniphilus sp. CD1]UXY17186.1 GGDEF domain-containing protein [Chitiniphilus sp. CD1]
MESLCDFIVKELNVGVFVLDPQYRVRLWNRFMAHHSGVKSEDALGQPLFELFPELPQKWLSKKVDSVFVLKNFAFTSWEQRPYLFRFQHNRPITGGIDFMRQNFTFMPVRDDAGEVQAVAVTLIDATDSAIYQTMLQSAMQRLEENSNRDGLTGVFNRRYTDARLSDEIQRIQRYQAEPFSVVLFDLDHFKQVNDTYGHLAGDEVLREVARRVQVVLREPDVFGRYGGEEFILILPQTDQHGARVVAERIRAAIAAEPVASGEGTIPVTASLGVACFSPELGTPQAVTHAADEALYHSKHTGRNQVTVHSPQQAAQD